MKRRIQWKYGILPFLLVLALGVLAMDRGEGVIQKLAYVLDPVYAYMLRHSEVIGYAMESELDPVERQQSDTGQRESASTYMDIRGNVQIIYGDGYMEEGDVASQEKQKTNREKLEELWTGKDYTYLIRNFYIIDPSTYVSEELFPVQELLEKDLTFLQDTENPQILIHHTHASEAYQDSREGEERDTVVGIGTELARILSEQYGYQVIHDKTAYDMVEGKLDRNRAYDNARIGTLEILEEYPSIQVIIDLHRDSGSKRVTSIDGKDTAQVMFFNGLSRNMNGPIPYLYNPYLQDNLAFSLQLQLKSMEHWEAYSKPIFLKGYEYNLSLHPRSLLVEVGTQENTLQEALNAMSPLAQILYEVIR